MGLTLFDLIAVVIVLVSALVGFTRGAVRELVTVFAFTLAAMAAIFLLPFAGPLLRGIVRPSWAANAAAVVMVFVVTYIALRLAGHWMTQRLHSAAALGAVDRTIGLGFGVLRALVFLGVFYLVFNVATPPELIPAWISDAKLYPVARTSAEALQGMAPKGLTERGPLGPALSKVAAREQPAEDAAALADRSPFVPSSAQRSRRNPPREAPGYDKRSRDDIDALIEKTR